MKAKKILAVLMTAAVLMGTVAGSTVTTFAAPLPTENDAMNVVDQIKNIEEGATITAYQIIDAKYTDDGFVGYKWVAGAMAGQDVTFTNNNVDGLTDEYVTNIALNTDGLTVGNLEALNVGTWMLLVTGTDLNKVYNPMIISVYYDKDGSNNSMTSGTVNADDDWELETTGAYAKSTEVPVKKEVNDNDGLGEADQVAVGDTVTYTITSTIPSYSAGVKDPKFVVSDSIVKGLEYKLTDGVFVPTVKVGGQIVNAENNYEVSPLNAGKGFEITFSPEYLKGLASVDNRKLEITYEAIVTEEAITYVGQNDVTIDYGTGTTTTTEYLYTVSFDGIAKKVGEGADSEGLAGAEFTLYETWNDANEDDKKDADELSDKVSTSTTSAENGFTVDFKGLDPDKTYYLTETKAPENGGYSINDTVYTITFVNLGEVAPDSTLTYEVWVDGEKKATVEYGHKLDTPVMTIQNTKLGNLPSTGGIGTTIFTIGGCVIMIVAAGLYFSTRKKEEN